MEPSMSSKKSRRLKDAATALFVFAAWLPGNGPSPASAAFIPASPEVSGNIAILSDSSPAVVTLGLTLTNAGAGAARRIQLSAADFRILTGAGTVNISTKLPLACGDLGAGSSSGQMLLRVAWPASAVRVQMLAEYTAGGGTYHSRQTFNLYR
jgi:hypothetical protein